ncbi:MAG: hypothetical protein FWE41_06195, partial [Coriobacteriia bacterium]|nr:hypothetical protein [Coriobacteriia bacterium]
LAKLLIASEHYDMDGAEKALYELERFEYEAGGELVLKLRESLEEADFEQIIKDLLVNEELDE